MKNPNAPVERLKRGLSKRWSAADDPGAEPRFQIPLLAKDMGVFLLLPVLAVIGFKACEGVVRSPKRPKASQTSSDRGRIDGSHSQIITFAPSRGAGGSMTGGVPKRAPGSLVKVRLLNVVETYSTAPVHAQIIDGSLGDRLQGGTLIGDATPDAAYDRISIAFRFARDPNREGVAVAISARALSLDGTLGLEAEKKEGFVARSAIGSAASGSQDMQKGNGSNDLQSLLLKALTAGLFQEMGNVAGVAKNRAQVLKLPPQTEFFAELTDFFPGVAK
jgi:hypothetical protein